MKSLNNRITSRAALLVRKHPGWLAAAMLAAMGGLALGSMWGNSAIVDEVAHIPAGYSYLHYSDYRLNPEHPPLIKDLAGLPLQFMNLKFPDDQVAWTSDVNGQWETGWNFLYHLGNNADAILFWARLPILLLALGFGVALYVIAKRRWGTAVALVVLFFYAFSPNFIAHATFVTTDVGASAVMFLALVAFARYAERPSRSSLLWLSVALGVAQLTKFSSVLLYPFLGAVALALAGLVRRGGFVERFKTYFGGFAAASGLSLIWVWLYYATQVARMPLSVQDNLIRGALNSDSVRGMGDIILSINHLPMMKPLAQYLLGIAMVFGRVSGGNVTYFNGQVNNDSFPGYFPELVALKTQLALLILALGLIAFAVWRLSRNKPRHIPSRLAASARAHVLEWMLGLYAVFYFGVSVSGNLNLGIRHILPIYVPIFVLVALGSVAAVRRIKPASRKPAAAVFALLLVWYGASTLVSYPNYLSYFNEAILGQGNSGRYFSDSSVDWGQDLKRLKSYAEEQGISKIAVDYFGGGVPAYYFCPRKYEGNGALVTTAAGYDCSTSKFVEWHAQDGVYPGQYIAVSETFLENDRYYAKFYNRPGYDYLRAREPIAKVGNSIYVYKLWDDTGEAGR